MFNYYMFLNRNFILVLTNCADISDMSHGEAFYLSLVSS